MSTRLNHTPDDIIARLLVALGLGVTDDDEESTDWPVFYGYEPDLPDNCITVRETTPVNLGRIMFSGDELRHHGILIRIRANDLDVAKAKVEDIYAALAAADKENVTIDASTYTVYTLNLASGPFHIGKDVPGGKRDVFTINYTVPIRLHS
jgi:hypothetical protein